MAVKKEKLIKALNNLLTWASLNGSEFLQSILQITNLDKEELEELGLDIYLACEDKVEENIYDERVTILAAELEKHLHTTSLWGDEEMYVEVRFIDEIQTAKQIISKLGFNIKSENWAQGSDYDAYYIYIELLKH